MSLREGLACEWERKKGLPREREREKELHSEKQRDVIADASSGMQWWTRIFLEDQDYGHGGWGSVKHKEKISSRKGELVM